MDYKFHKDHNVVIVRLVPGEEIVESLIKICKDEGIGCAIVHGGVGSSRDFVVNGSTHFFDVHHEITCLAGDISVCDDGKIFPHIHIACSQMDGTTVGGHLNSCVISATCEIFMQTYPFKLARREAEGYPNWMWIYPNAEG